ALPKCRGAVIAANAHGLKRRRCHSPNGFSAFGCIVRKPSRLDCVAALLKALFSLGGPFRPGTMRFSFGKRTAGLFCRPFLGFSMSMPFRCDHLIAICFEPRQSRGEGRAEPLRSRFEKRVDRAATTQKYGLLLLLRCF